MKTEKLFLKGLSCSQCFIVSCVFEISEPLQVNLQIYTPFFFKLLLSEVAFSSEKIFCSVLQ